MASGMVLTIAQIRFVFFKLEGRKINLGEKMYNEANDMFAKYGREEILAALKDFDPEEYVKPGGYPHI